MLALIVEEFIHQNVLHILDFVAVLTLLSCDVKLVFSYI